MANTPGAQGLRQPQRAPPYPWGLGATVAGLINSTEIEYFTTYPPPSEISGVGWLWGEEVAFGPAHAVAQLRQATDRQPCCARAQVWSSNSSP
jgi:hypothetical protein